jgi:hypothetical protein
LIISADFEKQQQYFEKNIALSIYYNIALSFQQNIACENHCSEKGITVPFYSTCLEEN